MRSDPAADATSHAAAAARATAPMTCATEATLVREARLMGDPFRLAAVSRAGILRRSSTGDDDAQAARATCILAIDSAWSAALMRMEMSMQQTVTGPEPGGE